MSHTNPYALQPLYIARVDPVTKKYTQAYFFLGAVPKNVLAAARRRQPKAADPRVPIWTAADAAILRAYYGASWRTLLTAEDPPSADESLGASLLPMFFTGGGEFDFTAEDEAAFELAPDTVPEAPAGTGTPFSDRNAGTGTGNIYTNISVYPEDNIYDLRRKLYLAGNVGIYQAHLFYYINDEGPVLPYRITVDGVPVAVDWHNIDAGELKSMAGIAIDQHMESRRDTITVEAFDLTTLLVPGYPNTSIRITRAYFVDLYSVIPPLSSHERPNDGLADILQDNFQFDLLYYGAILTYWPQLSPNAAKLALLDPDLLLETYAAMGGAVVTEAGSITAQNWAAAQHTASEKAAAWRMPSTVAARPTVAVTHASIDVVAVATRMHVNVRNVFDAIPTSPDLPAMVLSQADTPVQKRHLSSYQLRDASLALLANSGGASAGASGGESVTFITGGTDSALTQMTLMANGAYSVVRDWPEDDRVGFEMVLAELSKATLPLITKINALKSLAFPIGGTLSMPNSLAKIGSLTVSTFWPHSVSATVFRSIREQIRSYETAGIIRSWGLQRPGVHVFTFYRGISRSRATGHSYSWLVNDQAMGAGRTIRIIHRVLDIRIEIIGADSLAEFDIIRRYIFSFLDGLVTGVFHGAPAPRSKPHDSKGRLRRLREQDPNLFDLKKYDPDATVYSVLCQSNRQPILYSEAEAGKLTNKQQDRLTRYWNYTEKTPVYYTCLDPKYAHLSFRAGIHPLGYCLPCCKKTRISPTSRAAQVNKKCLSQAAPTEGSSGRRSLTKDDTAGEPAAADDTAAPEIMSHILSYGKPIPEGRISEIPKELSTALFLEAVAKPHDLYLVGVEQQSLYNLSEAGFAHAIVYAVAPPNTQPDVVIKALASTAASLTETYYHIGNGAGASFASAKALADAILMTFRYDMPTDLAFSPFSEGGAATNSWKAVLTDLVRYTYGIEIVTIVAMGKDATTLVVNPNAAAGIAAGHKFAIFIANDSGTYPLAVLDPKIFLQTRAADRWMVARRTFSCGVESDVPDKIATTVIDMINSATAHTTKCLSASFIEHSCFADSSSGSGKTTSAPDKPKIIKRLADNHGRCYGLILQDSQKRHVYIPTEYSAAAGAGSASGAGASGGTTELVFGERPPLALPAAALMEVFAMINAAARAASIQEAVIEARLVDGARPETRLAIGFVANGLYFYHDAIPLNLAESEPALPQIPIPYDCRLIDAAIVAATAAAQVTAAPLHAAAEAARAQNRLYRLFVAEFSVILQRERNEKIRERLLNTLRSTNFANNNSVLVLRKALLSILREYPEDIPIVRDAIARAYTTLGLAQTVAGNEKMFAAIAESLAATACSFDQLTVTRLHAMPSHEATVIAIRKIMEPRIHSVKAPFPGAANMFTTCDSESSGESSDPGPDPSSGPGPDPSSNQPQCSRGRLAIPEDRLADFYDLLADDVRNSGKMRLLASIGPGVFSPKEFIIRPDEVLL